MPGPGRSPFPTIGMSASWKASLWTRIEKLTDYICKIYGQVIVEIYPPTLSIYVCNKYLVRNICYFHWQLLLQSLGLAWICMCIRIYICNSVLYKCTRMHV